MDPNANLKEQMEVAAEIQQLWAGCNDDGTLPREQMEQASELALRLSELVLSLDHWLSKGGFLPAQWETRR
jgi:hypothetical protein